MESKAADDGGGWGLCRCRLIDPFFPPYGVGKEGINLCEKRRLNIFTRQDGQAPRPQSRHCQRRPPPHAAPQTACDTLLQFGRHNLGGQTEGGLTSSLNLLQSMDESPRPPTAAN